MRGFVFGRAARFVLGRNFKFEMASIDGIAAGGARRDRTDDLLLAKQALSQLSYGPAVGNAPAFAKLRRATFASKGLPTEAA